MKFVTWLLTYCKILSPIGDDPELLESIPFAIDDGLLFKEVITFTLAKGGVKESPEKITSRIVIIIMLKIYLASTFILTHCPDRGSWNRLERLWRCWLQRKDPHVLFFPWCPSHYSSHCHTVPPPFEMLHRPPILPLQISHWNKGETLLYALRLQTWENNT